MLRNLVDWFAAHNRLFTDPYAAAVVVGAFAGSLFDWLAGRVVPWAWFHLRRPVTLGWLLAWPFRAAARRRYQLGTARKDLDWLSGVYDDVRADHTAAIYRLDRLIADEHAARWPLEPVR